MGSLLVRPLVLWAALPAAGPQTAPPDSARLDEDLRLTAELALDAAQDSARFQRVGLDRAEQTTGVE